LTWLKALFGGLGFVKVDVSPLPNCNTDMCIMHIKVKNQLEHIKGSEWFQKLEDEGIV